MRICLLGASGLIGRAVTAQLPDHPDITCLGIGRRPLDYPLPAQMDMRVAVPIEWPQHIQSVQADVLVCALGTTIKVAGSQAQFRAIDYDLIRFTAEAARHAGIRRMVLISSVGADAQARNFYLKTKSETEAAIKRLGFTRLDILRPSLLRGVRHEVRVWEALGQKLAPVADRLLLHGGLRRFRSIKAQTVAKAVLSLATRQEAGTFIHEHDAIRVAAGPFAQRRGMGR